MLVGITSIDKDSITLTDDQMLVFEDLLASERQFYMDCMKEEKDDSAKDYLLKELKMVNGFLLKTICINFAFGIPGRLDANYLSI